MRDQIERIDEGWLRQAAVRLAQLARGRRASTAGRYLVGIAGIGGAGKSTLATKLLAAVEQVAPGLSRLVPMDGFHLPNATLDAREWRQRKGEPETFDAPAYIDLLRRLRSPHRGPAMRFPIYDRALHESVMRDDPACAIDASIELVITEGNYLLLDQPPWSQLADVLDECWLLDTPLDAARQWIVDRHVRGGRSEVDAVAHYERTDLANARLVLNSMREPSRRAAWGNHYSQ